MSRHYTPTYSAAILLSFMLLLIFVSCEENDIQEDEFTGKFIEYPLVTGSEHGIHGSVLFKERNDHSVQITIKIDATGEGLVHPAHLHFGAVTPDADLAISLTPVDGSSGVSISKVRSLVDDTPVTYPDLLEFDGHIKVHLDNGPNKSTVLSFGNIGSNSSTPLDGKGIIIANCFGKN